MGFGAKPQCKFAFVCGFCIVQNLCAGAAAPDNKPGTDAGLVCQKALHDAEPTKHTQPFTEGKGFGVRDREISLLIKTIDFFDKLIRRMESHTANLCL